MGVLEETVLVEIVLEGEILEIELEKDVGDEVEWVDALVDIIEEDETGVAEAGMAEALEERELAGVDALVEL